MQGLIAPNGQPANEKNVQVSVDQVAAVGHQLIDAQVAKLLAIGAPPEALIATLIDIATNLMARFEPAEGRKALVDKIADDVRTLVLKKAGQRLLASATQMPAGLRQ